MDWVTLVAEVSFPILVTFYLLTRIESKLEQLTFSIHTLSQKIGVQRREDTPNVVQKQSANRYME